MGKASETHELGMSPEDRKKDRLISNAIIRAIEITKDARGKSRTITEDLRYQPLVFECVLNKLLEEI